MPENPSFAKKKFLYNLKRAEYEKEWETVIRNPERAQEILAVMFTLIPRVGPFKAIASKMPSPGTESLYLKSVNASVEQYRIYLQELKTYKLVLDNREFDTGKPTKAGEYKLTDQTYSTLLNKLTDHKLGDAVPALQQNILAILRIAGCTYLLIRKSRNKETRR